MKQIGVQSVVVPEVVLVVLAFPVALNHKVQELSHSVSDVSPEHGSQQVEVRVNRAHNLVVGVVREALISGHVREGLLEGDDTVLHQSERTKPEYSDSWASEGSPLSVEVHFDSFGEHTVSTADRVTFDALSEVAGLFGQILELVTRLSAVSLVEAEELLVRASCCH